MHNVATGTATCSVLRSCAQAGWPRIAGVRAIAQVCRLRSTLLRMILRTVGVSVECVLLARPLRHPQPSSTIHLDGLETTGGRYLPPVVSRPDLPHAEWRIRAKLLALFSFFSHRQPPPATAPIFFFGFELPFAVGCRGSSRRRMKPCSAPFVHIFVHIEGFRDIYSLYCSAAPRERTTLAFAFPEPPPPSRRSGISAPMEGAPAAAALQRRSTAHVRRPASGWPPDLHLDPQVSRR